MSIVKMKRIRLVGLLSERDQVVREMLLEGCVEISDLPQVAGDESLPVLAKAVDSRLAELTARQATVQTAIEVLDKYAPVKTGLFPVRKDITVQQLFSESALSGIEEKVAQLVEIDKEITRLYSQASHLRSDAEALAPWEALEVPLNLRGTRETTAIMGAFPAGTDTQEASQTLSEQVPLTYIMWAGGSREQVCAMLICHNSVLSECTEVARTMGFSQIATDDSEDTARIRRSDINEQIISTNSHIEQLKVEIKKYSNIRDELKLAYDRLEQDISEEQAKERLVISGRVFVLDGWLSAPKEEKLTRGLAPFTCAYEITDPTLEDDVPVLLKSNKLTRPMNMVTEMYSLPQYHTGIDPNGLMMPFFVLFFGIMYADLGYGLVLMAISLISKKWKPRGTIGYMMDIMFQVGIATAIFGFLLGGFFGDLIPVFAETFLGKTVTMWAIIDPMSDPMTIMIAALILGAVQIIVGMAVKAYMCIRDGHPLDAIFDVGTWWLVFIGIGLLVGGFGYWVLIVGVVLLIATQGRRSPSLGGKIIGGIASLYDITGYLSDVLSYIRLMALMLATSVIGSVVNLLGSMTGNVVGFFAVFLLGHGLNMAINIVGTYVHTVRLQYLEFFGKFYEEGGRPFKPLKIDTKYHDVIDN